MLPIKNVTQITSVNKISKFNDAKNIFANTRAVLSLRLAFLSFNLILLFSYIVSIQLSSMNAIQLSSIDSIQLSSIASTQLSSLTIKKYTNAKNWQAQAQEIQVLKDQEQKEESKENSKEEQSAGLQPNLGLTVSPPVEYIQIKPGSRTTHSITVENSSDITIAVTPRILDFKPSEETGKPVLQQQHSFPYIENEKQALNPIIMKPKQKAQITLDFLVPASAVAKEYHLSVIFVATPDLNLAGRTLLEAGVASNIIVLVSGQNEHNPSLAIKEIKTKKMFDSFAGIKFLPIAKNEHFHASSASGSANIQNWRGQTIASFQIYPDVVLGFSERGLRALAGTDAEPAPIDFAYNSFFLLGLYKINVTLENNSELLSKSTTQTEFIFALPLAISVAILTSIFITLVYLFYIKRRTIDIEEHQV